MEKGGQYFDPYNFNTQQNGMTPPMQDMDMMNNPSMYYEQQYMYYKYMTQLLDYKMKMKEWEKMNTQK